VIVKDVLFEDEKIEKEIQEQQQFEGTDGWGFIDVRYNDGGFSMRNVKWEIKDKFFHIKEKGLESEEGKYIPLTKLVHFSFYYNAPAATEEDLNDDPLEEDHFGDDPEDPENDNGEAVDDNQKTENEDVPF